MSDLSAWQSADQLARQQIASGEEPSALADCLRHALLHTTTNSIADNYPPSLLLDALRLKVWTFERVMNVAAHISHPYDRVSLYADMLDLSFLSEAERAESREVALTVALNVEFPWARFWTLMLIIPRLQDDQKAHAVAAALDAVKSLDPNERYFPNKKFEDFGVYNMSQEQAVIDAFAAIAPHLNHAEVQQAIIISVETIDFDIYRAQSLTNLLPSMSSDQIFDVIETALALDDNRSSAETLAQIIPHLNADHFQMVLEGTLRLRDPQQRIHVLAALLPKLTGIQATVALDEAVEAIYPIHPDHHRELTYGLLQPQARAAAIAELAPFLTPAQAEHVLSLALEVTHEEGLAAALSALVPRLQHADSLERVFEHIAAWKNGGYRYRVLRALAIHADSGLSDRILNVALMLHLDELRAKLLTALFPRLSDEQAWTALQTILATAVAHASAALFELRSLLRPEHVQYLVDTTLSTLTTSGQVWRLAAIVDSLEPSQVDRLFEVARTTDDMHIRALMLEFASAHLHADQISLAFELLQPILVSASNHDKTRVLKALAPRLSRAQRQQLLDWLVSIDNSFELRSMLGTLMPHLDETQHGELIHIARAAADKRQTELIALLLESGSLTEAQLDIVLDTILVISDLDVVEELLAKISPEPSSQRQERVRIALLPRFQDRTRRALAAAVQIEDVQEIARALAALAPHLAGEGFQKALHAALELPQNSDGADALEAFAPHIPDEQRESVFSEILMRSQDALYRGRILARMANRLHGDQVQRLLDALESFTTYQEYVLLPLMSRLQETQIQQALDLALSIPDQFQVAVQAVARKVTTPDQVNRLLEKASALRQSNELAFTNILEAVAPRLSTEQANRVLELASTLKNDERRGECLAALVPYLDDPQRITAITRALDAVWKIRRGEYRANIIRTLAPHITDEQRQQMLNAALNIPAGLPEQRARALAALYPYFTDEQQQHDILEAWLTAVETTESWRRSSLFKEIVPYARDAALERVLQAAATIPKTSSFAYAVRDLLPYLPAARQAQVIADRLTEVWSQPPSLDRVDALASMLPLVSDKQPLLKDIWTFMLDQLQDRQTDTRQAILKFIADRSLFFPAACSPHLLERVVSAIIDVCLEGSRT